MLSHLPYLGVKRVARVRAPPQLLRAHPVALHRGVVCSAVKDTGREEGRGTETGPWGISPGTGEDRGQAATSQLQMAK